MLLHEIDGLSSSLQHAQTFFDEHGLPSRKNEDWKYTSTYQIGQINWQIAKTPLGIQLGAFNGHSQLPEGVQLRPLAQWLKAAGKEALTRLKDSCQHINDSFDALSQLHCSDGFVLEVADDVSLAEPIHLLIDGQQANSAYHLRNFILLGKNSRVKVIEQYRNNDDAVHFTNCVSDIFADKNSQIEHYKLLETSKHSYHVGRTRAYQQRDSQVSCYSFALSGGWQRSDAEVYLNEPNSHCELNGLYLLDQNQHVDHHTTVHHLQPHCSSAEQYKGILAGKSKAVFNGRVVVAEDAQKTFASQSNQNLLLSRQAEVNTKPQLEIYADDVKCSHGATVGQLDDDALFYLRARGIAEQQAQQLLMHAFAAELIAKVSLPNLAEYLTDAVKKHSNEVTDDVL